MDRPIRAALLIDADNVNLEVVAEVLRRLDDGRRRLVHRRAYGSLQKANEFEPLVQKHAIRFFTTTYAGTNGTDVALAIDAIELALSHPIDEVALVTSDCDFLPLVARLRELGCRVCGFGQRGKSARDIERDYLCVYDDFSVIDGSPKAGAKTVARGEGGGGNPRAPTAAKGGKHGRQGAERGAPAGSPNGVHHEARMGARMGADSGHETGNGAEKESPRGAARRSHRGAGRNAEQATPSHGAAGSRTESSESTAPVAPTATAAPTAATGASAAGAAEPRAAAATRSPKAAEAAARPSRSRRARPPVAAATPDAEGEGSIGADASGEADAGAPAAATGRRTASPAAPAAAPLAGVRRPAPAAASPADAGDELLRRILDAVPALGAGDVVELGGAAQQLRAANLLAKTAPSTKLFRKYPDHFELTPARQPNKVRYRAS